MSETAHKVVLVAVQLPDVDDNEFAESLAELRRLVKTLGMQVTATLTQRRGGFDPAAYVGAGKLDELKAVTEGGTADTIVVDHEITPSQARNLEKATNAAVMDRTGGILEIFHPHTPPPAAKPQAETA